MDNLYALFDVNCDIFFYCRHNEWIVGVCGVGIEIFHVALLLD